MKKLKQAFKAFFKEFFTPKLPEPIVTLLSSQPYIGEDQGERHHRENVETLMAADLKLQWEVQRRTLVFVQRTALISILSLIVAIVALIITVSKN